MILTPLSALLGTDLPIIQGGMAWVSRFELASAVSNAGGLGVLGAATMDPEELRTEIEAVRVLTDRPFAVNVPLICLRPDGSDTTRAMIDVVIAQRVPVVITGAGSARMFTEELQAAGATVLHVVPSPELARKAEAAGVDGLVAESVEAGGHVRADGLATLSLIPQVVDAVSCPVVAAGGIADGRGVLAALALGADGVQIGTRFIATKECEAHAAYKRALIDAPAEGSTVYSRAYHASRGLSTAVVTRLVELERAGAPQSEIAALRGRDRARLGCIEGQIHLGICPAGSGVGLVQEVTSVADVMAELETGMGVGLDTIGRILDAERTPS